MVALAEELEGTNERRPPAPRRAERWIAYPGKRLLFLAKDCGAHSPSSVPRHFRSQSQTSISLPLLCTELTS